MDILKLYGKALQVVHVRDIRKKVLFDNLKVMIISLDEELIDHGTYL